MSTVNREHAALANGDWSTSVAKHVHASHWVILENKKFNLFKKII